MEKFDPEYYRNEWNELKSLPSLVDSEKASKGTYLSAEKLETYARAGYAPCVWIEGKAWYRVGDVKRWVKTQVAEFQAGQNIHLPKVIKIVDANLDLSRRPICLCSISNLMELPIGDSDYPPSVYFLCLNGKVVYVGQTINLLERLGQHANDKVFDSVFFLAVPQQYLLETEAKYIQEIQPIYNKTPVSKRDELNRELLKEKKENEFTKANYES